MVGPAILLAIVSFLCLLRPGPGTVSAGQNVEIVNGVRAVHNTKGGEWANGPRLTIDLVRTLGDVDTTDETLAFNAPLDMAVDAAGNIYILDTGNRRIQKFGPDGKYLLTLGRKGQGPGEFSNPDSLGFDAKGLLYVFDEGQRRIQVLRPEGGIVKTIATNKLTLDRVRVLTSGSFVARGFVMFGMLGVPRQNTLGKLVTPLDADGNVRGGFGEPFDFGEASTNAAGNFFDFAVDEQDYVYVCYSYQNRIEKYSPEGQLLWRADRELNFSTKLIAKGKQIITANSASFVAPKLNRVAAGVAADDQGRVWVVTCDRQIRKEEVVNVETSGSPSGMTRKIVGNTDLRTTDMYKLEVFSPDGVLLGSIPLTHFVDMIYIHKDHLFLLDRDRGVKFYEYRINERHPPLSGS